MEAIGLRRAVIAADRGARQQHKVLSLLAVAQAEGSTPLAEMLVEGRARMRRGTVALVITPSLDRSWVAPLAALRSAGVAPIACIIDPLAHMLASLEVGGQEAQSPSEREPLEQDLRALLHLLAEHDVRSFVVRPGVPLGEQLVTAREGATAVAAMSADGRRPPCWPAASKAGPACSCCWAARRAGGLDRGRATAPRAEPAH